MSTVRWKRQADGSWRAIGYPIVIPDRIGRDVPITVRVPNMRMPDFPDGWLWSTVVWNPEASGLGTAEFWNIPDAKAWVTEHLGWLLQQAADDYDGDPSLSADAAAAATADWQARQEAAKAAQEAEQAAYAAPLGEAEQRLLSALLALPEARRKRVLDEVAFDARKARQ